MIRYLVYRVKCEGQRGADVLVIRGESMGRLGMGVAVAEDD